MYKELIKIGQKNIQHLQSCMNICEAQLWGGTKRIKDKYMKQLVYLKKKLKEEKVYIEYYTEKMELDTKVRVLNKMENMGLIIKTISSKYISPKYI